MVEWMIAAASSGSGKTVVVCALLAALRERGMTPCAFKCGPDYIDPMFHRAVLGVESHNLDLFLSGEDCLRRHYGRCAAGHGAAVTEGAMGFYDGIGGSDRASAWHIADTLDLPVLLVVRPKGACLTLAAQINGLRNFRSRSRIAGLFLNGCTASLAARLGPVLERETGLPVLGYLPILDEAALESRHLGLCTAAEVADLSVRCTALAEQLSKTLNWPRFLALGVRREHPAVPETAAAVRCVPIAVAEDRAFCFAYRETYEIFRAAGAELLPFSPLKDSTLPERACGLYLPGGYPELYARRLAENGSMRRAVRAAVEAGMPTVAECGGFLYLGRSLQGTDGAAYPMAGVLPGTAVKKDRLVRFGYAELTAAEDSLLFRKGERVPVHEFHYWDSTENGTALTAVKAATGQRWSCGFVGKRLYAAFPHLYFAGRPCLAQRFIDAAAEYEKEETRR